MTLDLLFPTPAADELPARPLARKAVQNAGWPEGAMEIRKIRHVRIIREFDPPRRSGRTGCLELVEPLHHGSDLVGVTQVALAEFADNVTQWLAQFGVDGASFRKPTRAS